MGRRCGIKTAITVQVNDPDGQLPQVFNPFRSQGLQDSLINLCRMTLLLIQYIFTSLMGDYPVGIILLK